MSVCVWLILSIQGTQWAVKLGSGGQRRDHVENQVHTAMQRSAGASWFRLVLTKFGDVHVVVLESRQKPALSWTQVPIQCDTTDVMLPLVETRQKSRLLTADARMQGRGRGGRRVPKKKKGEIQKVVVWRPYPVILPHKMAAAISRGSASHLMCRGCKVRENLMFFACCACACMWQLQANS